MRYIMVRYRVREEALSRVIDAVGEFVDAITKNESGTLIYEVFQEDDGVSFVHLMSFENEQAEEIHRNTPHVKKFVDILYPNCDEEPVFTNLNLIKSNKTRRK